MLTSSHPRLVRRVLGEFVRRAHPEWFAVFIPPATGHDVEGCESAVMRSLSLRVTGHTVMPEYIFL
jgi:hypothetical protein